MMTWEGLQNSGKSFGKIVMFSLSIQDVDFVVATKFTKILSKNSLGCHS